MVDIIIGKVVIGKEVSYMVIFLDKDTNRVKQIHYKPEILPNKVKEAGYEVDSLPEVEEIKGKRPELHYNPETKELWYEYKDKELTQEEKIAELEKKIDQILAHLGI